ncbi:sigma-70 family RNA polymerase sigma factor [Caulobacter sp.]|uniref:sigma-70 family RNA polymerase sigma factor n=1 Tax=Caulobacter sp. TaxID=78 RepID=UPI003BAFE35D
MTDISPTEKLLETSARWRSAKLAIKGEQRSFAAISERAAAFEEDDFKRQVVASIPVLRSFARGLCGDAATGDDLAQDALLKAWQHRAQFQAGTNFKGWLLKIARNHFYSQRRRLWRETPLDLAASAKIPATGTDQMQSLMLNDLRNALNVLSDEQREAAILVGAGGFSHRQAAEMCDVPEGTMKSRVCRARAKLASLLDNGDVRHDGAPASLAAHLIMVELSNLSEARAD